MSSLLAFLNPGEYIVVSDGDLTVLILCTLHVLGGVCIVCVTCEIPIPLVLLVFVVLLLSFTWLLLDVFQMKKDLIMEKCPGVISIHDDIVIYGTLDHDHDANLIKLMNVAGLKGLVLNSKKLELKRPKVSFFAAEYNCDGMHPSEHL